MGVVAGGARKARLARGVTVNGAPVTFRLTEPEGPAEPVDLDVNRAIERVGLLATRQFEQPLALHRPFAQRRRPAGNGRVWRPVG